MQGIDKGGIKAVILLDGCGNISGLLTDGDVRRALLGGFSLDSSAHQFVNREPLCSPHDSISHARMIAKANSVSLVLYGTVGSKPMGVFLTDTSFTHGNLPPILIMAGGKGLRLRPLTDHIPKPLIEIAGVPVLHRILYSLADQGFTKVYISVNYLAEKIKTSIGKGEKFGLSIDYLLENNPLGTAGSIALLAKENLQSDLIVMNADLIVDLNFFDLFFEHSDSTNDLTIVVREIVTNVPYGVVQLEDGNVVGITEKPSYTDLISAGVYCVSQKTRELICSTPMDMPDLISNAISENLKVGAFPIHREWIDIGSPGDLDRANLTLGNPK
jgi:dTDP-glucose pyrophosphorylase